MLAEMTGNDQTVVPRERCSPLFSLLISFYYFLNETILNSIIQLYKPQYFIYIFMVTKIMIHFLDEELRPRS